MHDKPVSLIAMDMDGTLLDSRQRLTPGNLAALRKAQAAGIHLAVCSGHPVAQWSLLPETMYGGRVFQPSS